MDMYSRNQYLEVIQKRYFMAKRKKEKTSILDEYCKNTGQNRKYVIRKIHSRICSIPRRRGGKKVIYDGYVKAALAHVWEIFDYPCGQRLVTLLKTEIERLRVFGELVIADEVAQKLKNISSATIDRKLKHQRQVLHLKRKCGKRQNSLLYQKIPVKAGGWDRSIVGQLQIDLVEHCGQSASGLFGNSVTFCELATGWWEAEAVLGKGQLATFAAITRMRKRTPFHWIQIHPDNDTCFINWHLLRYCEQEGIIFSRSRAYKKNDNSFVEQKNSTHIRGVMGHLRYATEKELTIINHLYRKQLRLYKNFFQPVMKLKEKIRDKGKVHRKYDVPKTPYQRLIESGQISEKSKKELYLLYESLNPAQLKRKIDEKLKELYQIYLQKNRSNEIFLSKKQTPHIDTQSYILNDLTTTPLVT